MNMKKADVWDFGAYLLADDEYQNYLTKTFINGLYDSSITPGSNGNTFPPAFSGGRLSWTGGSNDRLRTTNAELTRYDQNIANVSVIEDAQNLTGRLYVNGSAQVGRFLSARLEEDDALYLYVTNDSDGSLHFENEQGTTLYQAGINTTPAKVIFYAPAAGSYRIYDSLGKPSYFRIVRKPADYVSLSGTIDLSNAASIPDEYRLRFRNTTTKKDYPAVPSGQHYSVRLPSGFDYEPYLTDANGYIISNAELITVSGDTVWNAVVSAVALNWLSGRITGLAPAQGEQLTLVFTPAEEQLYQPVPEVTAAGTDITYRVQLETGIAYHISALGINDFEVVQQNEVIQIHQDLSYDIAFEQKPLYPVTILTNGLTAQMQEALILTFDNVDEPGYTYTFADAGAILLRSGIYQITASGLSEYPVAMKLTSYLKVTDMAVQKEISFSSVEKWEFSGLSQGDIQNEIYHGLFIRGGSINGNYLRMTAGGQLRVPVMGRMKLTISFTYQAGFYFDEDSGQVYGTSSGSTAVTERVSYLFAGTANEVLIQFVEESYLIAVETVPVMDYSETVTVGTSGEYQTIGEALTAASRMEREAGQRVTVLIAPGNYEEMLVVAIDDITLKNASPAPSIALQENGVSIDDQAVRITSYYGHGYSYFSMGDDCKYNPEVLAVNQENGFVSFRNPGSGTTSGSYWNATVVIEGSGFVAEDIIFENSFNQYISSREARDTLVLETGNKGERPTAAGDIRVQKKEFVERAAALALAADRAVFNHCSFVGRQDTLYGAKGIRAFFHHCDVFGGVDYIFGGMICVFNKCDLIFNTNYERNDLGYVTAAQQDGGRGYLMNNCRIRSALGGAENGAKYDSQPGYLGRPWQGRTSETVFLYTIINATASQIINSTLVQGNPVSLILPEGWSSSLGGEAPVYEYGTVERADVDNQSRRAAWSTLLTQEEAAAYTPFSFTQGLDGWDPASDYGFDTEPDID